MVIGQSDKANKNIFLSFELFEISSCQKFWPIKKPALVQEE